MKAIVHRRYGAPTELIYGDAPLPVPAPGQVRVRVVAASINAADWRIVRADPFLVRLMGHGFFAPKRSGVGVDVAGVVDALGDGVTDFRVGDEVFGGSLAGCSGSFAEYETLDAKCLVAKPPRLSFADAAAIPLAAQTALLAVHQVGRVERGSRVLIQGAGGGVGTFVVQLAKLFGGEVTAVTSADHLDLVRTLGADHVIDYEAERWTELGVKYDVIFGVGGYTPLFTYARHLAKGGRYVAVGGTMAQIFEPLFLGKLCSLLSGRTLSSLTMTPTRTELEYLATLASAGELRSTVDRVYPLERAVEAISYVETGRARGKVVLEVGAAHLAA